ncbi:MAG: amino acid transport protein [Planctomycetota bacterium]|nr:amino acid transport protein [Planctomycetota bacterium]
MSTESLFLHLLFGCVGMGYVVFGRKQKRGLFLLCGAGLWVCPYVVPNLLVLVIVSLILVVLPFYFRD